MAVQPESSTEEIRRLRRCINDLVSVLALPAIWTGGGPSHVVGNLLDALVSMLNLDFIYARLGKSDGSDYTEMMRIGSTLEPEPQPQEIKERLRPWLTDDSQKISPVVSNFFDGRDIALVSLQLGLHGEMGLLVAGSGRSDFPQQTERLVLNVAANQAAIGLHEANLLSELDQRVAQRTAELTSANEQLHEARAALEKAFDELKKSETKLRQVIDAIPTLAWCHLPDGTNEFLNKGGHDYTGITPEEMRGWGWQATIHPEDLPPLMEKWQKMLVTGEPGEIEARLRRHDGIHRWFILRAQALRDDAGTIVRWYGTSTDIDDRKRVEEALREREFNLRQITETIPEMLWSATPEGAIDYCNSRLLAYTGISDEEVKGNGWMKLLHPDDVDRVAHAWMTSVKTGVPYRVEVRIIHAADGTYRWCVTNAFPLVDSEVRIIKWHGTVVDMHDWKQAQEELRNTQAELARVTRVMTMGQLTASIAHEVNQPLSGIVTNASTCLRMLDANPPNLEGARETVRRTIRDGNRASDVITRLRTLYSKRELVPEPMDLNEATREVISLSVSELERNRVVLRQDLAEKLPPIMGDRIQIQQVILNLVRNGSDAMSAVDDRPRELTVKTNLDESGGVCLSVKDLGVGIDPEIESKLFEPFYTTKSDGMGIGLSVSRSIMESHRGRLWAVRNEGPGATFLFSIPCGTNT